MQCYAAVNAYSTLLSRSVVESVSIDMEVLDRNGEFVVGLINQWLERFYTGEFSPDRFSTVTLTSNKDELKPAGYVDLLGSHKDDSYTTGMMVNITKKSNRSTLLMLKVYTSPLSDYPNELSSIVEEFLYRCRIEKEQPNSSVTLTITPVKLFGYQNASIDLNDGREVTRDKPPVTAIVGRTNSGKSWLLQRLVEAGLTRITTYTTRPPREGEQNGVDYHFITDEKFDGMVAEGSLVGIREFLVVDGTWRYAIPATLPKCTDPGKGYVIVVDPAGYEDLIKHFDNRIELMYLDHPTRLRKLRADARGDGPREQSIREIHDKYDHDDFMSRF